MSSGDLLLPAVLVFNHLDPTGASGLTADIETLASVGCHAATVTTALSVMDQFLVHSQLITPAEVLLEQAAMILKNLPVSAIKIAMTGDVETIYAICDVISHYPEVPVILDPMLKVSEVTAELVDAINHELCPLTTVLCLPLQEARMLTQQDYDFTQAGLALLKSGCKFALLTGTHQTTPAVINHLYAGNELIETYSWERIHHHFHGAGDILTAALAGMFAQGFEPAAAIHEAQQFTWECLQSSYHFGTELRFADRLFWARETNHESNRMLN